MAEEIRTLPSGVQYKVIDGVYGGLVGNEADIASMTNAYNQPENLVSALDEVVQTEKDSYTYSGDKTGKTVTFDDGSVLTQKGFNFQYEDADGNPLELDTAGIKQRSNENKNDALSNVVGDIKQDLTEEVYEDFGGKEGALVSEYLSDQQAIADQRARTDERQDEAMFGKGGTMDQLNEQVQREADALGISTDQYYGYDAEGNPVSGGLSAIDRGRMAVSDIGEIFTEDGELFQNTGDVDPNNARSLGLLGEDNLTKYKREIADKTPDEMLRIENAGVLLPTGVGGYDDLDGALTSLRQVLLILTTIGALGFPVQTYE